MPNAMLNNLDQLAPMLAVTVGGIIAMLMAVAKPHEEESDLGPSSFLAVSLLSLAVAGGFLYALTPAKMAVWNGVITIDRLALMGQALIVGVTAIALCIGAAYLGEQRLVRGEYFALTLFSAAGMMLMVSAVELLTFFVGLEIMSLAVYVLVGFRRADRWSQEAALKYFVSGAFASAFFLFGAAFLFGATGSTEYRMLTAHVSTHPALDHVFVLGATLCFIGFAFKIAAVPFHMWAPDAYQGAPTMVTGFMAVTVKAAAFVSLLRFTLLALGDGARGLMPALVPLIEVLAIVTMTVGNLSALLQRNIKRMLAYSSIAHAGYLLVGIVGALERGEPAVRALLFYLLVYSLATIGAFGVLVALERRGAKHEEQLLGRYAGVGFAHPALGLAFVIFMFALSGIPPTAGFMGKVMLFAPALDSGHVTLVVIAVLNSVVSVYYYLQVVVYMFMKTPTRAPRDADKPVFAGVSSPWLTTALAVSAILVLLVGMLPGQWLEAFSRLI